ncbi:invasion associated locus B family protein [Roseivivax sp. CAU 1761]
MRPRLTHLSLIALMAATPAFAQDEAEGTAQAPAAEAGETTETAPETGNADAAGEAAGTEEAPEAPAAAETGGTSPVDDALDTGIAEPGEAVGQRQDNTFVKSEEGDWKVECIRLEDGSEGPCQLYQLLRAGEDNPVAEARIFKVEGGGQVVAGANVIVPLETLLTQKLTIAVDGGQAKRYDFAFCTQIGCIARIGFTQEDLNGFKRGAVANVSIVPALAPDQRVVTEMSLSGFTAGFDQLTPIPSP